MNPISYTWKGKNNPDIKLGLIAQDLLKLIPEVVKTHTWEKVETRDQLVKKELERLGVNYSDLIPVLINAIKEQQKIISKHSKSNDDLKTELQSIKQNYQSILLRIEDLESGSSKDSKKNTFLSTHK